MRQFRHRMMVLVSFGMTPPLGRLSADGNGGLRLHLNVEADLREYYRETKRLLQSILSRNGCRLVETHFVNGEGAPHADLHFSTAHQVGSCRMAETKSRGVVNVNGEVFDYPGLYVADGAAIPTSLVVNTSLTILANAERMAAGSSRGTRRGGRNWSHFMSHTALRTIRSAHQSGSTRMSQVNQGRRTTSMRVGGREVVRAVSTASATASGGRPRSPDRRVRSSTRGRTGA
ncbi:MAG: hypothetical protein HY337_09540 [Gemmatimonadetes bacterium]|nr:hypothetical protein [Gemmatimonadota bacterium]